MALNKLYEITVETVFNDCLEGSFVKETYNLDLYKVKIERIRENS